MSAVSRVELAVLCHDGTVHFGPLRDTEQDPQWWVGSADLVPQRGAPDCGPHRLVQRTITDWQPVPEPMPMRDCGCPK